MTVMDARQTATSDFGPSGSAFLGRVVERVENVAEQAYGAKARWAAVAVRRGNGTSIPTVEVVLERFNGPSWLTEQMLQSDASINDVLRSLVPAHVACRILFIPSTTYATREVALCRLDATQLDFAVLT